MKVYILAILLVLALSGLGSCSKAQLGTPFALVGPGTALAYEFSDYDRQAAGLPPQTPQEQMARQWERDQSQAQRLQQDQERAHNSIKQFDPQEYNPPAPYNLYQPGGKTSVCQRGFNGAIHCY